jgi:hypothetical protein
MPPFLDITRESSCLMNEPRKKNPTFGVAVFIVVAVLLVIATLLYNAISGKREFDRLRLPRRLPLRWARVALRSDAAANQRESGLISS